MTGRHLTVAEAARELGVSAATVRRRIRQGQLRVIEGNGVGGRNLGYRVCLDGPTDDEPSDLLLDFLRRDCGLSVPAHALCGITRQQAAQYLLLMWRYAHIRRHGAEPDELPPSAAALQAIAVSFARD